MQAHEQERNREGGGQPGVHHAQGQGRGACLEGTRSPQHCQVLSLRGNQKQYILLS